MSDNRLENDCGLIIDPALLVDIRAQCEGRRRELEAAGTLPPSPIAPGSPQGLSSSTKASPPIAEAERFAAAVSEMSTEVRRFFQYDEPIVSPRQLETAQDRAERQMREGFGGWCV
jgi:hypothetical protein